MLDVLPYRAEYATGKTNCNKCANMGPITSGTVQIAVMQPSPSDDCIQPTWYHQHCFFSVRRPISVDFIDGFANLRYSDQKPMLDIIGANVELCPNDELVKAALELESEIKYQNGLYFSIYDELLTLDHIDHHRILTTNNQFIPEKKADVLNHLTDVVCFGALLPCSVCKDGRFVFNNFNYCCTGFDSPWTKCVNATTDPKRVSLKRSEDLQDLIGNDAAPITRIMRNVVRANDDEIEYQAKQPLFDLDFLIVGETKQPKKDIVHKIRLMGGRISNEAHRGLAAVIINAAEVDRFKKDIKWASDRGIQMVPEEFLNEVMDNDPIEVIVKMDISKWGRNPYSRLPQLKLDRASMNNDLGIYTYKHLKSVDPVYERDATVYCNDDLRYDVTLDYVDIGTNKNSFFKLQVLQTATLFQPAGISNPQHKYVLRLLKGRIGTLAGSKELTVCKDVHEAKTKFKQMFMEKTGNEFGAREFVKKAGKYHRVNIDYEDVCRKIPSNNVPTKLTKALYELMQLLVNEDVMKSALLAYCLGGDSMPLGKITMQQIDDALNFLAEISWLLEHNGDQKLRILDASNQFYSYVPHGTGFKRPPIIDTLKLVQDKVRMLKNVSENCLKYDILTSELNDERNMFDVCYEHLGDSVEIKMINKASDMYAEIDKYMKNTQIPANQVRPYGYNRGSFEIDEVFEVTRHEEVLNYKPYELHSNRQLLFHGSPIVNFFNILTNGLKIAPPEAQFSGAIFGRGIYFTDSVTKAANYSQAVNGTGLALLCEVALGFSDIHPHIDNEEPIGHHDSVLVFGQYAPNQSTKCPDGMKIPNGELVLSQPQSRLTFNEYVVFDPSRVKIRYMVKFTWKRIE